MQMCHCMVASKSCFSWSENPGGRSWDRTISIKLVGVTEYSFRIISKSMDSTRNNPIVLSIIWKGSFIRFYVRKPLAREYFSSFLRNIEISSEDAFCILREAVSEVFDNGTRGAMSM